MFCARFYSFGTEWIIVELSRDLEALQVSFLRNFQ